MSRPNDSLAEILKDASEQVQKWPEWKRSDDVRREFRKLYEDRGDRKMSHQPGIKPDIDIWFAAVTAALSGGSAPARAIAAGDAVVTAYRARNEAPWPWGDTLKPAGPPCPT